MSINEKDLCRLPVVAMRGVVVFPEMVMHFDVAREKSIGAITAAYESDKKIFLTAQKDVFVEDPEMKDLYRFGVIAEVRQILKTPEGVMRVLVEGISKAKLESLHAGKNYLSADVQKVPYSTRTRFDEVEMEAVIRTVKDLFEKYSQLFPRMPKELIVAVMCQDNPYKLFNSIIFNIALDFEDKQQLLEENNILKRLNLLYTILLKETEVLTLEREIQELTKEGMDKSQREYYLREQMRAISSQLGEEDEQEEVYEYLKKIQELGLPDTDTDKLYKEAERLSKLPPASQESFVIRSYLDVVLDLPWNKSSKAKISIEKSRNILDKDHYGMEKVKERVLESISVHALMPDVTGQILCLVGPPGVGKTSIGRSIAKSLGRKYERISLGGVRDESDIRGHRKTYIGAMPGRIIDALTRAGTNNPLILLDEIDKMSSDFKGDPSAAMLEVLDSEQNKAFRDHYVEVPFDLSQVLFVATANTLDTIPAPLLDRMEVIELGSYTREEKFHIAKEHLIAKQIKKHGLKNTQMKIQDSALYDLIDSYTRESGVRELERYIASLCRKAAKAIVSEEQKKVTFTSKNIECYLGPRKYLQDEHSGENTVGLVNGLAWTSVGGVLMPIEVIHLKGKGQVEITGSLGDVMKESAKIAVSYVRSIAKQYGINPDFYEQRDIHIHAPEGAVPKDGPSAGVTMVTAIVSALSGIPVRSDVAMTGEITLHGKVLPIGGLREKAMAAYRNGIRTVIIPEKNVPDLHEVDEIVKKNIEFVPAGTLDTVLKTALVYKPEYDESQQEQNSVMIPAETKNTSKPLAYV
ncbi:MAG: endopeptidase La [Oscillospiraceae bacterium]|nr:endopeptidase La [Oscillospiraceae bacterium]